MMTSTMMVDRGMMAGMSTGMPTSTPGSMMPPNMMMVPRCTFKIEKCQSGMKMVCTCSDPTSCSMMQNLCQMLAGGMCSVCCIMNGMMVCCCNLTMGTCKVEMTKDGCCITCTSGDKACCEMIQACCDCLCAMMKAGCTYCLMMNGTPVCCGTC